MTNTSKRTATTPEGSDSSTPASLEGARSGPSLLARGSRLALRIYLIGLVQFLIVAGGMEMNRRASHPQNSYSEPHAHFIAGGLARIGDDPEALARELARVRDTLGWSVILHNADGSVRARADAPGPGGAGGPHGGGGGPAPGASHGVVPVAFRNGELGELEYVSPRKPPSPNAGPGVAVPIALILLVVGIAAWLTARALTGPLTKLTSAARAFGAGRLDVRLNMDRTDEIGEMARAFDDMADRITRLVLAERELLANVSHELRTPLARIRVALDLAHEGEPQEATEMLGEIAEDLAELERLVDDVLAAARLALQESGSRGDASLPVRREPLDMQSLVEKAVSKFRLAHPRRKLDVHMDPNLPEIVGDAVLVRRVVDNLLDNAHKYTDDDDASISLRATRDGDAVGIEIVDHGIGIDEADLQRLFEPFFRADRSRARATGGLGLGLVLARRVVEAHAGTIAFTSKLGEGTRVRVRLPGARKRH